MRNSHLTLTFTILLSTSACGAGPQGVTARTMAGLDANGLIPVSEAISIAEARLPGGFVVGAQLDLEDRDGADPEREPLSFEVVVYTPQSKEVWHVGVDALTGAITEAEVEDRVDGVPGAP